MVSGSTPHHMLEQQKAKYGCNDTPGKKGQITNKIAGDGGQVIDVSIYAYQKKDNSNDEGEIIR
jgi:hypothetical protein